MVQVIKAVTWVFAPVRQVWKDYKVGRTTRQKNSKEICAESKEEAKSKEENQCKDNTPLALPFYTGRQKPKTPNSIRGWRYRAEGEFPWRLEQIVQEESNWRGTWVLEIKDMQAMDWDTVQVPKEDSHGARYQRKPTRHLPFLLEGQNPALLPSEGGQDDLMVWLGKR